MPGKEMPGRPPRWEVETGIAEALKNAFRTGEADGRPQLTMRFPSSGHPLARKDKPVVTFRGVPSLLLTDLPEIEERGRTRWKRLLEENREMHGQQPQAHRVTSLIGPWGAGKTRTALEALCHEYGFYFSFCTETGPGTYVLLEAMHGFLETHRAAYAAARGGVWGGVATSRLQRFRNDRLRDLRKFIAQILLAFALGLLKYLDEYKGPDQASPKGFLLFQLIGVAQGLKDWQLSVWKCLRSLSPNEVEQKLADAMVQLKEQTGQPFFNVFLDEAHMGTWELLGYFPSGDNSQGRPLLNGMLRTMESPLFEHFHFNLIGRRLSFFETAASEEGAAAQPKLFTDFTFHSRNGALGFVREFLCNPPEGLEWGLLVGRPHFAAFLVYKLLEDEWLNYERALEFLKKVYTNTTAFNVSQFQRKLRDLTRLQPNTARKLRDELRLLLQEFWLVGKGVSAKQGVMDFINVGACYLESMGECTTVALREPLVAIAIYSFLAAEDGWLVENKMLELLQSVVSDSHIGLVFERLIPAAQLRFLTTTEGSCLAHHPLLTGLDLPECFYGPAQVECLVRGDSRFLSLQDCPRVNAYDETRGVIQFLGDPDDDPFFLAEPEAGPDVVSFVHIGNERWVAWVQVKARKKVGDLEVHALGTLGMDTMFSGDPQAEEKRSKLLETLEQQGVKGILQILVAYPEKLSGTSHAGVSLRHSERLQNGKELQVVQVCVTEENACHYLTDEQRAHLDCLKGADGA